LSNHGIDQQAILSCSQHQSGLRKSWNHPQAGFWEASARN